MVYDGWCHPGRDPERIDPFLKHLGDIWKKHPDLRFGQLIENVCPNLKSIWNLEEREWELLFDSWDVFVGSKN